MRAYLKVRWRVLSRQLAELGWWRLVVLSSLLGLFCARALVSAAAHDQGQWAIPFSVAALLWSAHRQRKDLGFLQMAAPGFQRWLSMEYVLLSLPAVLVLILWGRVLAALLTLLLAAVVAFAPAPKPPATRLRWPSIFRSVAFEWVSGLRGLLPGLVWVALLVVAGWSHASAIGPALALVGWLLLVLHLYGTSEPWTMLLPALTTPGAWLRQRLRWALLYFTITSAPLLWLIGIGPAGWGGIILLLLWCWLMLVMSILAKYAFYPNTFLLRSIQAGVLLVGVLILSYNSAYAALLTASFIGLLLKSRRRLATYRND